MTLFRVVVIPKNNQLRILHTVILATYVILCLRMDVDACTFCTDTRIRAPRPVGKDGVAMAPDWLTKRQMLAWGRVLTAEVLIRIQEHSLDHGLGGDENNNSVLRRLL